MVQCICKGAEVAVVANREKSESHSNNNRKVIRHQFGKFQYGMDVEISRTIM